MKPTKKVAKKAVPETCLWSNDNGECEHWETSCHNAFEFNVDGPKENGFKFCPYCGLQIEVAR